MAVLPEATCDLCAVMLSVDDDVQEDLMKHGFEGVPFGVAIHDQGAKAGLPGIEQAQPCLVQRLQLLWPRFRIHLRPGRKPGKVSASDARQPDLLGGDDVRDPSGDGLGGLQWSEHVDGAEHAMIRPQVIGEEAAQVSFCHDREGIWKR